MILTGYTWSGWGWSCRMSMRFSSAADRLLIERDLRCANRTHIPLIAPLGRIDLEVDASHLLLSIHEFDRPIKRSILGSLLGYPVFRVIYGLTPQGYTFAEIPVASEESRKKLLRLFQEALDELDS